MIEEAHPLEPPPPPLSKLFTKLYHDHVSEMLPLNVFSGLNFTQRSKRIKQGVPEVFYFLFNA